MNTRLVALAAYLTFSLGSAQALAHHSFAAEFDGDKPVSLSGVVLKLDWTNPHTYIHIEVENEDGSYEEWALELGSPNGLMRRGWTRNTLDVGAEIMVRGTRARDGSNKANAQVVVISDTCQRLFAGTSQTDFEETDSAASGCQL